MLRVFEFAPDPQLDSALLDAAARVLASRWFVLGEEASAFEREFAAYCRTRHCVGVANGTDALELALRAVGVAKGDAVAVVANAGYYGCTALAAIGAHPAFVDIDDTLTMSPAALGALMPRPKAVVVTHLYGRLAAIEAIVAIADEAGVPVIEDCAQAHGASRNGRRAGSFGAAGCFSFYPTKNLGAAGDAGAVVTSDEQVASRLRELRQYGWTTKYRVERAGGRNSRLDEIQAAFLRVKLPRLESWNSARRAVARRYDDAFRELGIALPAWSDDENVAHLYVIRITERERLREHLSVHGIATDVHYPIPDHRQCVSILAECSLPQTEAACAEVLTLPCFPGVSETDVERVVKQVRAWVIARRA
jgi:dTDP-4-amino-4,6-dideoxygalactose transaminase